MIPTCKMLVLMASLSFASLAAVAEAPWIDPADDPKHFGQESEALFWTLEQKVAGFRNMEKIGPVRKVEAGGNVFEFAEDKRDIGGIPINHDDRETTLDDYFIEENVVGLIVIKNGSIIYERYASGNSHSSRWISFSVTKSITSMLVGAAVQDGYIRSLDEKVTDYLPRLKDSSYQHSTIRNILQMSSGVEWNEDYADRQSDINQVTWPTIEMYEYLRHKPSATKPGVEFNYNTAETNLVGTLLRSAIGNNLSTYLSEKIWKPFGMESDAIWSLVEPGGGEYGGCCLSMTLRDYARVGWFALRNGVLNDGTRVLPEGWMEESTTPSKGYEGYGYQWWLRDNGVFQASGIFGQGIHINPQANVVIAVQSAWIDAADGDQFDYRNEMYLDVIAGLEKL